MGLIFNGNNGTDTISATDGSLVIDGLDLGGVGNINAGIGTFTGNLNVGGVLTYEDVKNVDSVGIITARAGIKVTGGNVIVGGSSDAGYPNYADNLTIHGTSNEGITVRSGTSHQGALYFSDSTGSGTGTYEGFLIYDHNINDLTIGANHNERIRIASNGRVGINSTIPETQLDVYGGEIYYHSGSTGNLGIKLSYSNSNSTGIIDTYGNHPLEVRVNNSEKLRILSTGVVNIGDRSDNTWIDSTLKVRKDQNAVTKIAVRNEDQGSSASAAIVVNSYGNSWMFDCGSAAKNSNALTIRVDATASSNQGTERLKIDTSGNLRFGQTTQITCNTADGSDNQALWIGGGGGSSQTRGGQILLHGNEYSGYNGTVEILAGNSGNTQGSIAFFTSGVEKLRINSSGQLIMTNAATQTFADFSTTNNNTRSVISLAGKTSGGAAVTLKMGGFGDTSRGEIFTYSNHGLGFATNNAATQMILDTGGRLLVGTSVSPASANTLLRVHTPISSSSVNSIEISHNTNGADKAGAALGLAIANGGASTNAADLYFSTATNGSLVERLRITSAGAVLVKGTSVIGSGTGLEVTYPGSSVHGRVLAHGFIARDNYGSNTNIGNGMYSPASNSLSFATNSLERLRIDSSGRLQMGSDPSNLGAAKFNIVTGGDDGISLGRVQGANVSSGDVLGTLAFQCAVGSQTTNSAEASIKAIAAENSSGTTAATNLSFYTKPTGVGPGSSPTERLKIWSTGTIGALGSRFLNYINKDITGFAGGSSVQNYIVICAANQVDMRLSGTFHLARATGTSGVAISRIQVLATTRNANNSDSALGIAYNIESDTSESAYNGIVGKYVTLTYNSVSYFAIKLIATTGSDLWGSFAQHCNFVGVGNNVDFFGLNSSSHTISSVSELTNREGTKTFFNSNIGINEPNPDGTLHVSHTGENNVYIEGNASTLGSRLILKNKNTTTNCYSDLSFDDAGGNSTSIVRGVNHNDSTNEGFMEFYCRPANQTPTKWMDITPTGELRGYAGNGKMNFNKCQYYQWGGSASCSSTWSVQFTPIGTGGGGNIYHIKAYFSHHSLGYGAYLDGVYGAYSGHTGLQINTAHDSHSSSNGGSWAVTRASSGSNPPVVVTHTAGTYNGSGHWFIWVLSGTG